MPLSFDPHALSLPKGHLIGGAYVAGPDAIEVRAPSSGAVIGAIPCADAGVVDLAVAAARKALATSKWAVIAPRERLRIAFMAAIYAVGILMLFGFAGNAMLHHLGVTLEAFRAAMGIILFIMGSN